MPNAFALLLMDFFAQFFAQLRSSKIFIHSIIGTKNIHIWFFLNENCEQTGFATVHCYLPYLFKKADFLKRDATVFKAC